MFEISQWLVLTSANTKVHIKSFVPNPSIELKTNIQKIVKYNTTRGAKKKN